MKNLLIYMLFVTLIFTSFNCCSIGNEEGSEESLLLNSQPDTFDYKTLWQQVATFNKNRLPKSALKVINKIYEQAKANKNAGEFIKSLIHKMRYIQEVEEDTFVKVQKELNQELKASDFPIKPILHSMIAEQYWNYYQSNRYRFMNRSATVNFKQ